MVFASAGTPESLKGLLILCWSEDLLQRPSWKTIYDQVELSSLAVVTIVNC